MLVIGLTGGIASGKSLVAGFLRELGAAVIDADELSRQLVEPGLPAWQEIKRHFGAAILDERGYLDRKKLAGMIFQDQLAREKLNGIIHPRVIAATKTMIAAYKKEKAVPAVVVDAPLLIEAGMASLADEVWVVVLPKEKQLERLMKRDKLSREEAEKRINSQMPISEKLRYADRVIDNSGTVEKTLEQVSLAWNELV